MSNKKSKRVTRSPVDEFSPSIHKFLANHPDPRRGYLQLTALRGSEQLSRPFLCRLKQLAKSYATARDNANRAIAVVATAPGGSDFLQSLIERDAAQPVDSNRKWFVSNNIQKKGENNG